jgi:flagellar basal body-associated protein FliL
MSIKKRHKKMRVLWIIISLLAVLAMVGFTIAPAFVGMK